MILFFYIAFSVETNLKDSYSVAIFSALYGFVIPIIYFVYLRKHKKIIDNDASEKEQRTGPYAVGVFLSFLAMVSIYFVGGSMTSILIWSIYLTTTLFMIVINKFWKISAHAIGISIPVGAYLFLNDYTNMGIILLIFLISWARLKLKVHTFAQVLAGGILGFFYTTFVLIFFSKGI